MTQTKLLAISMATLACATGLASTAAPARAGDFDLSVVVGFGAAHGDSFFGVGRWFSERPVHGPRPAPLPYPPVTPAPFGAGGAARDTDSNACREFIPSHDVCTQETVCVPAVYEDRVVPVFDIVCVPILKEICVPEFTEVKVPVFEERCVPIMGRITDPRTGRSVAVKVGERKTQVQVGERIERRKVGEHKQTVKVGERKERVQIGERVEHVLVRAETTRVVDRVERVPGRWVLVVDDGAAGRGMRRRGAPGFHGDAGNSVESMTRAEFEREMALVAASGVRAHPARH